MSEEKVSSAARVYRHVQKISSPMPPPPPLPPLGGVTLTLNQHLEEGGTKQSCRAHQSTTKIFFRSYVISVDGGKKPVVPCVEWHGGTTGNKAPSGCTHM